MTRAALHSRQPRICHGIWIAKYKMVSTKSSKAFGWDPLLETLIDKILSSEVSDSGGSAKAEHAVVFAHGFTGNVYDTWKAEG